MFADVVPMFKHGGSSDTVRDCFGKNIMGNIVKIYAKLRKEQCLNILIEDTVSCGSSLIRSNFIFIQDNGHKHG